MKQFITSHPDVQGGELCVRGTRTPVAVLLHLFTNGYSLHQIHELYPWIPQKELQNVITEVIDQGMQMMQVHG